MTVQLDRKGKFFTEIVKKNPIRAVIQTSNGRIEGTIHLHPGHRLLDDLDHGSGFLAVTEIEFLQPGATDPVDFIALNLEHIIWIQPLEERTRQLHGDD
ncbi:MAG: hypothetical protein P8X64_06895 [Anaerolineales bacterium]|jgi:hypothetical protein